ncbi:MAG TPA: MerR family transcriptional regulator [Acidimicrobiales bacterium]|nr:MerR family transcriptional regulator [Acidimicrobiales bacterium]
MSSRTYLSIGDVLTLLREEFPDVTISKIRFLESQGLVNPERSPSGYRKFFDHDVERLRWVLRQQREHFLPLKVIRDRLEDGELDEGAAEVTNGGPGRHAAGHVAGEVTGEPAPAGATTGTAEPTKADEEAMARILADASRRTATRPAETEGRRGLQVVGEETAAEPPGGPAGPDAAGAGAAPVTEPARAAAGPARSGSSRRAAAAAGGPNGAPSGGYRRGKATGTGTGTARSGAPAASGQATSGTGTGPGSAASASNVTTGASLTLEELCAASGLSAEEVAGLRSFGLIEPMSVAGIETFDEDALTVANLAASFGSYGIEPRHLRLYRNAVDREVGLIEQVVIPLLRLRNPESRQRAVQGAEELASLGQSLRATLLRSALKRHLGG